jgi:hypothetical protein
MHFFPSLLMLNDIYIYAWKTWLLYIFKISNDSWFATTDGGLIVRSVYDLYIYIYIYIALYNCDKESR